MSLFALNIMGLENVFTWSLQSLECGKILINFLQSVQQKTNQMIALVETTQESQIKIKLHMNNLQESVEFISAKFHK